MERIGVGFSGGFQPKEVVECVRYAEQLGYDSAWMTEGHGGDQFSILTACALETSRIKLGTSISSVFVRSAPTIAMAAACVDEFSSGRFILGLGSSHRVQVVGEHGLGYGKPLSRVKESMEIIRSIWDAGEIRSFNGAVFDIDWFNLWFTPYRAEIPIYLGAVNSGTLQAVGEQAQGVILTRSTLQQTRKSLDQIVQSAKLAGRNPIHLEYATQLGCSVDNDKEKARDRLRDRIAMYAARFPRYREVMAGAGYGEEVEAIKNTWVSGDIQAAKAMIPVGLIDDMALVGTPSEIRERIQEYRDIGVTLPIIMPSVDAENRVSQTKDLLRLCAPLGAAP